MTKLRELSLVSAEFMPAPDQLDTIRVGDIFTSGRTTYRVQSVDRDLGTVVAAWCVPQELLPRQLQRRP